MSEELTLLRKMGARVPLLHPLILLLLLLTSLCTGSVLAQEGDDLSLQGQHAKDKLEMHKLDQDIKDINSAMTKARGAMGQVESQLSRVQVKDFTLTASWGKWELRPGISVPCLMYNQQVPGPVIRVEEGDPVRIAFHNHMKVPTSLYFHGMTLPQSVNGLPRQNAGLIPPGGTYTYQFFANQSGTFWYHPQIIHADQVARGLCGVLIVEPKRSKTYDRDQVLVLGQWSGQIAQPHSAKSDTKSDKSQVANASAAAPDTVTYFWVNGKSAPAIPAIEVHQGERLRLRIINVARQTVPLSLTGHHFEVMSVNGSGANEPRLVRDSLALAPGDRYDLEFVADNPGVWSLSSQLPEQTTNQGQFPGGIALVVRYLSGK